MDFTGYIDYNKRIYTFHYKNDYLTLIVTNPNEESQEDWFYGWSQYEKVDLLIVSRPADDTSKETKLDNVSGNY